jgi:hypothetical protein
VEIVGVGLLLGLDTVVSLAVGAGGIDRSARALVWGLFLALVLSPLRMAVVRFAARALGALGVDPAVLPLAVAYLDKFVCSLRMSGRGDQHPQRGRGHPHAHGRERGAVLGYGPPVAAGLPFGAG